MKFNNVLITGGAGFIGSHFLKLMAKKYSNTNFINLDLLTYASDLKNIAFLNDYDNYKFYEGDICDSVLVSKIFKNHNIDAVINFAAESHVDNSIKNPSDFIKTNINGTFNLLKTAYSFWMKEPFTFNNGYSHSKFLQISTDEVYGSITSGSFNESSSYNPSSPYSSSKAGGDLIVRSYNKTYGLPIVITLSCNNFGSNQNKEKFIPVILNCLNQNIKIPVYGDGLNIRDWISVEDNCKAIELVFTKGAIGESYNIGGENEFTNIEIIKKINYHFNKISGKRQNIKINFIKDRYGHDQRYSIDTSKIKNYLNWNYSNSKFDDSIESLIISFLSKKL